MKGGLPRENAPESFTVTNEASTRVLATPADTGQSRPQRKGDGGLRVYRYIPHLLLGAIALVALLVLGFGQGISPDAQNTVGLIAIGATTGLAGVISRGDSRDDT